jgi:hypothetical protein
LGNLELSYRLVSSHGGYSHSNDRHDKGVSVDDGVVEVVVVILVFQNSSSELGATTWKTTGIESNGICVSGGEG